MIVTKKKVCKTKNPSDLSNCKGTETNKIGMESRLLLQSAFNLKLWADLVEMRSGYFK